MSVFADTSGLYALIVKTEFGHDETVEAFKALANAGRSIHTTSYVLIETIALLQHRIGLAPVRDFDDRIMPLLTIEWVSPELHAKGIVRLTREDRRHLSLVDCVSFEHMRAAGLKDALALDEHFADAGFSLLPRRKAGRGAP